MEKERIKRIGKKERKKRTEIIVQPSRLEQQAAYEAKTISIIKGDHYSRVD